MRIGKIFYFLLVAVIIGVPVYWSWSIYSSRPSATDEWAFVTKVIDGDTIKIEGGRKVRYIGVDTPETKDPRRGVQCFGKEASEKNRELVEGKRVRLEKDVREADDFGRLLRYVWLDSGIMVNLELIEQGYAQSYTYPPDVKHQEKLLEAHRRARSEKRGLWGACEDVKDRDQKKKPRKVLTLRGFFSSCGSRDLVLESLPMHVTPIKTRVLIPPKDDLLGAIQKAIPRLNEGSILVITSKVVSIWQGRCLPQDKFKDRDSIAKIEADRYLPREAVPGGWSMLTIKERVFVASAGIDKSNANGYYVLWPDKPKLAAKKLCNWAKKTYGRKNIGVVITDSHTVPMRRGTIGISIGHYGFAPLRDYRGTKDLFGRSFVVSQANLVDSIAAAAVAVMGEGDEQTPIAVVTGFPVKFLQKEIRSSKPFSIFEIPEKEDIYSPFLKAVPWKKGGGGKKGLPPHHILRRRIGVVANLKSKSKN